MAHRTTFFRRMSPELSGSIFSFLFGVAIIFILYGQHVGAVDSDPATVNGEYNCTQVTDCIVECGNCDAPRYKYKFIHSPHCGGDLARKRRQVNTEAPITTTTTPPTTTVKNAWMCKNCSVVGCKKCRDELEPPACENCQDGYLLNNETHTCSPVPEESGLSGVATAGIVIAVLCIVGLAVVIVLFVLRKYRGSRDVTGHSERTKPISSTGGNVSSNVPQISKINTKELLRKHDQITRYMKSPTSKDSPKNNQNHFRRPSNEHKELEELGDAPAPPTEPNTYTDMQSGYDPLDVKTQNDPQLYLPLQHEEGELYLNTAVVENEFTQAEGIYQNTQQTGHRGVTKANDNTKHPAWIKPQDSIDTYEPVERASSVHEPQEIYANDDSTLLVQNSKIETDEMYVNEDVDDVYQNT